MHQGRKQQVGTGRNGGRTSSGRGRRIPLSGPRRVINDILSFGQAIPTVPVEKQLNIAPVVAARKNSTSPARWPAIFLRAYALTAMHHPELRRVYVGLWNAHLFESDYSQAVFTVEREYQGEKAAFFGRIHEPERRSIRELDREITSLKQDPIESISAFRRMLLLSKFPQIIRRAIIGWRLYSSGPSRVRRMGTLGVSVYSGLGAQSLHPISPVTSILNYGPISAEGNVCVRIVYDHRVTDGAVIARALHTLEHILNHDVVNELEDGDSQSMRAA